MTTELFEGSTKINTNINKAEHHDHRPEHPISMDSHLRAQTLPAYNQAHSVRHTQYIQHHQGHQGPHQTWKHTKPGLTCCRNRSSSSYWADAYSHGGGHNRGRQEKSVSPNPNRRKVSKEVSADALTEKLKELINEQTAAGTSNICHDSEGSQPPLLVDRTTLISLELQQRGEEALQDILEKLESKKGTLTEIAEPDDGSVPRLRETVRREHTYKLNPELLKDIRSLSQHHGSANLRHH